MSAVTERRGPEVQPYEEFGDGLAGGGGIGRLGG